MRILITGAGGMVGAALAAHCRGLGDEVFAHERASLDITRGPDVREVFARERPDSVINCAAWTDVDACERDEARARLVNAEAVGVLAAASRAAGASFVTISTDYVFRGDKGDFYTQRDDPDPQSAYGRAKLAGERLAQSSTARSTVVRTGWVYGPGGRNFLARVVELARAGTPLKAIRDAFGTPTYAPDLARRLRELAALDLPGVYHVTNAGDGTSFEGFAREALRLAGCDDSRLESVSMDSLDRPAPRPRDSRLRCLLSPAVGLPALPDWRDALREYVGGGA
ncbi:MAG TPA: dTDP-4-dehydrorhamnose reductase, partial [Pyrinomonadaceae bacterium]